MSRAHPHGRREGDGPREGAVPRESHGPAAMTLALGPLTPLIPKRAWHVYAVAVLAVVVGGAALNGAVRWYGHPFAEVLVDSNAVVSGIGSPDWASVREKLHFPDRIVDVDGEPIE